MASYSGDASDNRYSGGQEDDYIGGGGGDDVLRGRGGNDRMFGDDGRDLIWGGKGDDELWGSSENGPRRDKLFGEDGNDAISADYYDIADGGAGIDTLSLYFGNMPSGLEIDLRAIGTEEAVRVGKGRFTNFELVDRVVGTVGDDVIWSGPGGPPFGTSLYGLDGNDRIVGSGGEDFIAGGIGDDQVRGDGGDDQILGGDGADQLSGGAGADRLSGEGGDDVLDGGGSADSLDGGFGVDTLFGGGGDDNLDPGAVYGTTDGEFLSGGDGNDFLWANTGAVVLGGEGHDTVELWFSQSAAPIVADFTQITSRPEATVAGSFFSSIEAIEILVLSEHDDVVTVPTFPSSQTRGGGGNDRITGTDEVSYFSGGTGNDQLFGLAGDDQLRGDNGDDIIWGGDGDDGLDGGWGSDILYGGKGIDWLTGDEGADRFVFEAGDTSATAAAADTIQGFSSNEGDRIDLSLIDANEIAEGVNGFTFIGTARFSGQAGEVRYVAREDGLLVSADTDGDRVADLRIQVYGQDSLVAGDFILGIPAAESNPLFARHLILDATALV